MTAPTSSRKATPATEGALQRLSGLLTGAVIGIAFASLGLRVGGALARSHRTAGSVGLQLTRTEELVLLAVVCATLLLALLAHELGHLLGGRLVGFRAFLLIVGPLKLQRTVAGWRVVLNRSIALAGGLAGTAPMDTHNLRRRTAIMVAGGPVTSLVAGGIALLVALALDPFSFSNRTPFSAVVGATMLGVFGLTSVMLGLVTLIPGRKSGFRTDGAQLLHLWRGGVSADVSAAIATLIGLSLSGTRPRDYPSALLTTLDAAPIGSMEEYTAWQMQQSVAADRGDNAAARALLDRILSHIDRVPQLVAPAVYYDAAAQCARWGDATSARSALQAANNRVPFSAEYLRPLARGAVHALDGDAAAARREFTTARTLLPNCMVAGAVLPAEELIAEFERRLV